VEEVEEELSKIVGVDILKKD
jgi:hypothetical protein